MAAERWRGGRRAGVSCRLVSLLHVCSLGVSLKPSKTRSSLSIFCANLATLFAFPPLPLYLPPFATCQLLIDDIAFALLLLLLLLFVRSAAAAAAVAAALQAFNEQTERTQNYKEATSVCLSAPPPLFHTHCLCLSRLSDWSARIYTSLQAACKHQLE